MDERKRSDVARDSSRAVQVVPTTAWKNPPEIAQELGIDVGKVLRWIRDGQLKAVNVAASLKGRPRWRISTAELDAFLRAREAPAPAARRRRKQQATGVTEFF